MFDLYLPILPPGYLSHSVITTVWIGIWVISFFNLRYGWTYSGLIIPGYLTPLLLIKPVAVGVIIFEAIVTYFLVYLLSEIASRRGLWTIFFGRDRFFLILIVSIAVRLIFDGWALPFLDVYISKNYNVVFDHNDSLHSFGLIIVALIANQLWKPGFSRGSFQLVVTVGITYLVTRYFFVEFTNFSVSNISYMYENIASSLLASPKSYIILIITALIASRMNLLYGWEFNGILVPSLLAVQWNQPSKILISFIEAYIILALVMLILKLPIIRDYSIEGARKVLLFFNVGYLYKIGLSFIIIYFLPEYKVSDYFAFGYLLSSLIAIKMYDKVNIALFTRATVQTSVVSIIIATTIGYLLTMLPSTASFYTENELNIAVDFERNEDKSLITFLSEKKIDLYNHNKLEGYPKPTPGELAIFNRALDLIDEDFEKNSVEVLNLLWRLKYKASMVENHYLVLFRDKDFTGWGIYVIDLSAKNNLSIEVPFPLKKRNTMESAIVLMKLSKAKVMAISSAPTKLEDKLAAGEFNSYYSLYYNFHKHYAKNSVVQVKTLTPRLKSRFLKTSKLNAEVSLLFIKGYVPKSLSLSVVNEKISGLDVSWDDVTDSSLEKDSMLNGFGELYLSEKAKIEILSTQFYLNTNKLDDTSSIKSLEGVLQTWLLDKKIEIAKQDSELYTPVSLAELLFFDQEILVPIHNIVKEYADVSFTMKEIREELLGVSFSAKQIGYKIATYKDIKNDKSYIILHEKEDLKRNCWGTYVFRINNFNKIMVQTPRPFFELNTFEFSLNVFEHLDAKVLAISGTHPLTNRDYSADVMLKKNKQNIFNLVSQVAFRESEGDSINVLQIRGMSDLEAINATDAILSIRQDERMNETQLFMQKYISHKIPLVINNGSIYSAGFDSQTIQSLYLRQSLNDTFSVLWLPQNIRSQYKQIHEESRLVQQFKSVKIQIVFNTLVDEIKNFKSLRCFKNSDYVFEHIKHYLNTKDITELEELNNTKGLKLKLLIDTNSKQPYMLVLSSDETNLNAIVKIYTIPPYIKFQKSKEITSELMDKFMFSTSTILTMEKLCEE